MALFKSVTALIDIFMMSNPFKSDVIELPFAKTDKTLMDFADVDYFRNPRNPEYNRFIHIDAAFSTNTLDVYGLAGSYSVFVDDATYTGAGNGVTQEDIFSKKWYVAGLGFCSIEDFNSRRRKYPFDVKTESGQGYRVTSRSIKFER
jgi:hypothetical protein